MNPPIGDPVRKPQSTLPTANSIEAEIISEVEIVSEGNVVNRQPSRTGQSSIAVNKQSIFERMLNPQSLQIMMSAGGAILVIGLAIWLWTMGAFDNPIIASLAMGASNLGLLGLGVFMVTKTRYSLAGRGLAFLSALLLPLHLWFYSAQELIVVSQGGHLWIPALIICGLYALVARLTRDAAFVYQLVGGIVLTGLLFLAGPHMSFLSMWPVIPTCLFLVALGTVAIHVDRFFVEAEGAFSRNEFGKAFFVAGHLSVVGGLGYLLIGQLAESIVGSLWTIGSYAIGQNPEVNFWSLPVLATAGWAYTFSHLSRARDGRYLVAAIVTAVWILLTALQVFSITLTPNLLLLLLASVLVSAQIGIKILGARNEDEEEEDKGRNRFEVSESEVGISIGNSVLAAAGFGQAVYCLLSKNMECAPVFLAQGILTVLSLSVKTELIVGEKNVFMSNLRLGIASALLTLLGVLGLGGFLNVAPIAPLGILTGMVALTSVMGLILNLGRRQQVISAITTGGASGILIAFASALVMGGVLFGSVPALVIMLVSGACLLQVGLVTGWKEALVASCLVFATCLVQIAVILNITSAYAIIAAISLVGVALLLASKGLAQLHKSGPFIRQDIIDLSSLLGNVGTAAGATAAMLLVIPKMVLFQIESADCILLLFQLLPLGLAYAINRSQSWRNSFVSLGISTAVLASISFAMTSNVPVIHRIELIVLAIGVVTLVAGHIGWLREQRVLEGAKSNASRAMSHHFGTVSANLGIGSILVAVPMILGIIMFRFFDVESGSFWKWFHEIGGLTAGLVMLGGGIMCKIRSTTIGGFATLAAFLVTLVVLIRLPDALQSVSVLMMAGGGIFFAVGILLSIYREWILGLPAKIKDGEGVFQVLKWR